MAQKTYTSPELDSYGSIEDLTQGENDNNGSGGMSYS